MDSAKAFEVFAQQLTIDQSVLRPIQVQFIREQILPNLTSDLAAKVISQEDATDFLKNLLSFLEHRDSDQSSNEYLLQLRTHINYPGKFNNYLHVCGELISKTDRQQVQFLVQHEAHIEMLRIKEILNSVNSHANWSSHRDSSIGNHIQVKSTLPFPFIPKPLAFDQYGNINEKINFNFWRAVNTSESLKPIYGELLVQQDAELYSQIIDKSLNDNEGTYIQKLIDFPKPDSIHTLCLIAAADYQNYRTYHANSVLHRLAKRSDWPTLVDAAISQHPHLERVKDQLLGWDFSGYNSNTSFRQSFSNVAFDIVSQSDENTDHRVFKLAAESLPNQNLIPKIKESKELSDEQVELLRNALVIAETTVHTNYTGYAFGNTFRRWAIILASDKTQTDIARQTLSSLASLSKEIIKQKSNPILLDYFLTTAVSLLDVGQDAETLEAIAQYPQLCPAAFEGEGKNISSVYVSELFKKNPELLKVRSLPSVNNLLAAYKNNDSILSEIISLLSNNSISIERATELPSLHPNLFLNHRFYLAAAYPAIYLSDTKAVNFFFELETIYSEMDTTLVYEVSKGIDKGLPKDLAKILPKQLPIIFDVTMNFARASLFDKPHLALRDMRQVKFLKEFIGKHGPLANQLISDWTYCLQQEAIMPNDTDIVMEFCDKFRLMTPEIIGGYKIARENGQGDVYLDSVMNSAQSLIRSVPPTETERGLPYYAALVRGIFPNNAGQYGKYEAIASCSDRSSDIEKYKFEERYILDLVDVTSIKLKEGETLSKEAIHPITDVIYQIAHHFESQTYEPEKMQAQLAQEVEAVMLTALQSPDKELNQQLSAANSIEEKLFLLLAAVKYGKMKHLEPTVKQLLITYEFAYFQDVREYINGTNDRVNGSLNPDYSLLTELHSFYADRLKEINRKIIKSAWQNTAIQNYLKDVYKKLAQEKVVEEKYVLSKKLRIENLGISEPFLKRIAATLKNKNGRESSVEKVASLINRYERMTMGFTQHNNASDGNEAQAIIGQIVAQKNKSIAAWQALTGEQLDPSQVFLNEINLSQYMDHITRNFEGTISDEGYASYTGELFASVYEEEMLILEGELDKFVSKSGKKRRVLNGFISKTKESAHARMVGGVCVSRDTPSNNTENMWDMENYFQFVYQDPETLRCVGLCLLHEYSDQGKKILTVSINPSATYLQNIDEKVLFDKTLIELAKFAKSNGFDMICSSSNEAIRTNRTGGLFEKAFKAHVERINKKFTFSEAKIFSYNPAYSMKEMDILWENGS